MAEQRLSQRKGLMTQTIRRARQTSQVLICHLPSPTTTPSLAAQCSPCLGAHRQSCPLSRALFVQHCSLCIASPPMYL